MPIQANISACQYKPTCEHANTSQHKHVLTWLKASNADGRDPSLLVARYDTTTGFMVLVAGGICVIWDRL